MVFGDGLAQHPFFGVDESRLSPRQAYTRFHSLPKFGPAGCDLVHQLCCRMRERTDHQFHRPGVIALPIQTVSRLSWMRGSYQFASDRGLFGITFVVIAFPVFAEQQNEFAIARITDSLFCFSLSFHVRACIILSVQRIVAAVTDRRQRTL